MSIEEALREFEEQKQRAADVLDQSGAQMDDETRRFYLRRFEMAQLALAALLEKAVHEDPQPLQKEELLQMKAQPIYVVPIRFGVPIWRASGWCVLDCGSDTPHKGALIPGVDEACLWPVWRQGETWTACPRKPGEAVSVETRLAGTSLTLLLIHLMPPSSLPLWVSGVVLSFKKR